MTGWAPIRQALPWLPLPPYMVDLADAARLRSELRAAGFEVAQADASVATNERDLLLVIGGALGFPEYYRPNWDAFDDCVGDLMREPAPSTALLVEGADRLLRTSPQVFVRSAVLLSEVVGAIERERGEFRLETFFVGSWQVDGPDAARDSPRH